MVRETKIPGATIERIALYLRSLEELLDKGVPLISSDKLASLCGVNSAQVRKDLSYFGEFGVRGLGYEIHDLLKAIRGILALDRPWRLGIVGVGNMGTALIRHEKFFKRGYRFVAAFDSDPEKIGKKLVHNLIIQPMSEIKKVAGALKIEIGVITTPSSQAQAVADMLVDAGIRSILNFSPIQVRPPKGKGCLVENVDFTVKLDNLAYHLSKIH
ncbi:MAG: redox-sensing transcriptional repressor Rex [Pseudomonadota bacterium]